MVSFHFACIAALVVSFAHTVHSERLLQFYDGRVGDVFD